MSTPIFVLPSYFSTMDRGGSGSDLNELDLSNTRQQFQAKHIQKKKLTENFPNTFLIYISLDKKLHCNLYMAYATEINSNQGWEKSEFLRKNPGGFFFGFILSIKWR